MAPTLTITPKMGGSTPTTNIHDCFCLFLGCRPVGQLTQSRVPGSQGPQHLARAQHRSTSLGSCGGSRVFKAWQLGFTFLRLGVVCNRKLGNHDGVFNLHIFGRISAKPLYPISLGDTSVIGRISAPFLSPRFSVCVGSMGMFQQLLSGRGKYRLPSSLRYTEGQAFIDLLHPQRRPGEVGCGWGRSLWHPTG